MSNRLKAVFGTVSRKKTSIWPGDIIRYDIKGVYIWRPGDGALEPLIGRNKYIVTNPGILSLDQMRHIALQTAELIGLLTNMPHLTVSSSAEGTSFVLQKAP